MAHTCTHNWALCTTSIAPCSLQIKHVLCLISFLNCLLTLGPSPSPSHDPGEYNLFLGKGSHPHLQTTGVAAAAQRPRLLLGLLGTAGGGIAQRLGARSPGIGWSACLGFLRAALASPAFLGSPRLNSPVQNKLWAEPPHRLSAPCLANTEHSGRLAFLIPPPLHTQTRGQCLGHPGRTRAAHSRFPDSSLRGRQLATLCSAP